MIKTLVHFSDLHIRLYKDHDLYRSILETAIERWKELSPDRIIFTGDLVHSKNQMTPELIEMVSWVLNECAKITKTVLIIGNHDFLENNMSRLDALTPIIDSLQNDNIVYYKNRGVYEDENIEWVEKKIKNLNAPKIDSKISFSKDDLKNVLENLNLQKNIINSNKTKLINTIKQKEEKLKNYANINKKIELDFKENDKVSLGIK